MKESEIILVQSLGKSVGRVLFPVNVLEVDGFLKKIFSIDRVVLSILHCPEIIVPLLLSEIFDADVSRNSHPTVNREDGFSSLEGWPMCKSPASYRLEPCRAATELESPILTGLDQ